MNDKIVLLFFLFSTYSATVVCQEDSTHLLSGVTVQADRITQFSSGVKLLLLDSVAMIQYKNRSMADLLSDESPICIKSYGQGSLATSSFRGGSASQTAILWNGLNINNITNGQLDFSLIPVSFSNNVTIQFGGVGALWGNGAIGGAIHLNNTPKFNSGLSVEYGISGGSFHSIGQNITLQYGSKSVSSTLTYQNKYAANDFEYEFYNQGVIRSKNQERAEFRSIGFVNNNSIQITKNQLLNISFWSQKTERNLPPTLLEQRNKAEQNDLSNRFSADWKYNYKNSITHLRAGYFNEQLHYIDSLSNTNDTSSSNNFIAEIETKLFLKKNHTLNLGINNTYSSAKTSGYDWNPNQNRTSLFASYQFENNSKKLNISTSIRQEFIPNLSIPFTYSVGIEYQIWSFLSTKANMSRLYRLPTFNDLYWNPGGNPNLLPENGYSEEVGIALNYGTKKNSLRFKEEISLFNRTIDNWIIWLPSSLIWTPQNILSVWSRGLETHSVVNLKVKKINIQLSLLTSYVLSTNEKSKSENDNSVGKQLIFVPIYSGNARLKIEYKSFSITYRHHYTGYRYISTDHSEYLTPYQLGSVNVNYQQKFKNYYLNLYTQIDNIWDELYQIMPNRPMPNRNFNIGITFNFNYKNKQNL
jgi:iron complex outermembrane receptor protein